MKRLKSLVGLAAGLMLAGSMLAAPALAQPPTENNSGNNTTNVVVTITDNGAFDAYFCAAGGAQSGSTNLLVSQAPTVGAAGLATGQLAICYVDTLSYRPGFNTFIAAGAFTGGPSTIPLSGFKVTKTYNVVQQFWGNSPDYGDIGYFVNQAYPSGQAASTAWTTNNTLDSSLKLQFGWPGIGTGASFGAFDVSLGLPIGTQAGIYTSVMTLSIVAGANP